MNIQTLLQLTLTANALGARLNPRQVTVTVTSGIPPAASVLYTEEPITITTTIFSTHEAPVAATVIETTSVTATDIVTASESSTSSSSTTSTSTSTKTSHSHSSHSSHSSSSSGKLSLPPSVLPTSSTSSSSSSSSSADVSIPTAPGGPVTGGGGGGAAKCGKGYTYCGYMLTGDGHNFAQEEVNSTYCKALPELCTGKKHKTDIGQAVFVCMDDQPSSIQLMCACSGTCLNNATSNYIAHCDKACVNV